MKTTTKTEPRLAKIGKAEAAVRLAVIQRDLDEMSRTRAFERKPGQSVAEWVGNMNRHNALLFDRFQLRSGYDPSVVIGGAS